MKKIITIILFLLPSIALAQFSVPQGGTGKTSFPQNSLIYADSNSFQRLQGTSSPTVGYITATSTTATSTFPNIWSNNISGLTSAGLDLHSNNGTPIALFGAGGGAGATFYGGVNIDGATRLATSLTGILKATSGTVSTGSVDLTTDVTGVLPVANGGTNNSSAYTAGSLIFSDGTKLTEDNSSLFYNDTYNGLYLSRSAPTRPAKLLIYRKSTDVQGTVTTTSGSGTVTGSGTIFQTQVFVGDKIVVNGEMRTVLTVPSDTSLTTDAWTSSNSGQSFSLLFVGAGRVTTTSGSGTVTGTGTAFLSDVAVGDTITVNGETRTVSAIASNTSLTTDNWSASNTTQTYLMTVQRVASVTNAAILGRQLTLSKDSVDAGGSILFNGSNIVAQTATSTNTNIQATSFSMSVSLGARNTNNWTDTPGLTVTNASAVTQSGATGTVTNFEVMRNRFAYAATGATVTNTRLFTTGPNSNSGTMTNTYGYYVDDITTGTQTNTPYGFYNSDANSWNYFAGKTGIGTTTPGALLAVTNTGTEASFLVADTTDPDSTPFIIDASGNVGIGIASPIYPLSIQSATADKVSVKSTTGNNELRIYMDDVTANGVQMYTVGASSLGFSTNSTGNKLTIDSNGMVAIGSTVVTNTGKLHVAGASGIVQTGAGTVGSGTGTVYNRFSSTGSDFYYGVESSTGGALFVGGLPYAGMFGTANATAFQIATNNNTRLTIGSTGNVGIGTTSPNYPLQVKTSASTGVMFGDDTTGLGGLLIGYGGNLIQGRSGADLSGNSGNVIMQLYGGNVGIGTSTPAKTLDVLGTIRASGGAGNGWIDLVPGGSTYQGYFDWIKPGGTRVAYLGYQDSAGSANNLALTLENGANFVTSGGSVGIGTTSPATLLQLFSTASTTLSVDSNSATKGSCIELKDSDGVGYTYVTANNGVLTASTVSCK